MQKQLFPLDLIVRGSMNGFIEKYVLILFVLNWTSRLDNLSNTMMYMKDKWREFKMQIQDL